MILVDTSVGVDYLRPAGYRRYAGRHARTHRGADAPDEAIYFIEQHRLMGKGIGFIDVHLLAAVTLHGDTVLGTRDQRLARLAEEMGLGFTTT